MKFNNSKITASLILATAFASTASANWQDEKNLRWGSHALTHSQHHNIEVEKQVSFNRSNTALLIIDAQQAYVPDTPEFWPSLYFPGIPIPPQNRDHDIFNKISRIAELAKVASANNLQTGITYEGFPEMHSPFINEVEQQLPDTTQRFYKAYFNSTKEATISTAMQELLTSGVNQIIVAGAETDVCVLQTVLGLKKMGFEVFVVSDAVFSTESYTRPTFKRMQQAGIKLAKTDQIIDALNGSDKLVLSPRYAIQPRYNLYQGDRHKMASVSFNLDARNIKLAEHDNKEAVSYRARQWSNFVGYSLAPASGMVTFNISKNKQAVTADLKRPFNLQEESNIKQVIRGMQNAGKNQAIISGIVSEKELIDATIKLIEAGIVPVILEDNLMGKKMDPIHFLDTVYSLGAIPSTFKTTGYEITQAIGSIDLSEAEINSAIDMQNNSNNQTLIELMPKLR
ncbi:MAG: isochorismatase family protein [Psychromonas sp.]|nr:isochorismatase family protein [Alteromonadales bacterium]MCP5079107.1 isochorismatase family protein [Psychromonas sp.]